MGIFKSSKERRIESESAYAALDLWAVALISYPFRVLEVEVT